MVLVSINQHYVAFLGKVYYTKHEKQIQPTKKISSCILIDIFLINVYHMSKIDILSKR